MESKESQKITQISNLFHTGTILATRQCMAGAKPRILIVDDDRAIRESLEKILRATGYMVELAGDGREGLTRLKQRRFNLVILDLNLPKLTGFDVLDVTREATPILPVIVLTGLLDQCEPAALLGADLIFEKPPEVIVLLEAISGLLSQPAKHRIRQLSQIPNPTYAVSGIKFRDTRQVLPGTALRQI